MKHLLAIAALFLVYACSSGKTDVSADVEVIPVDVRQNATDNPADFIKKIEVLPLETNDSSLINTGRIVTYSKEMNAYAIYNSNQQVTTFDGNGRFLGSSQKVRGAGPEEYTMALDIKFNPYQKGIDLLNPDGTVYTYSLGFDFIGKRTFKPEFVLNSMLPLSKDEYIFAYAGIWVDEELVFANLSTNEQQPAFYSGSISPGNSSTDVCFYPIGEDFYFIPRGVNYYIFRIDKEQKKLTPIIYLDFGKDRIADEDLPGRATGERTDNQKTAGQNETAANISKEMQERFFYVYESDLLVPSVKLFNEDYVYINLMKAQRVYGTYIYNRKRKAGHFLEFKEPHRMLSCFWIEDNVLMTICDAFYAKEFAMPSLMSPEEMKKIEKLGEEDNPVIFKYYLK